MAEALERLAAWTTLLTCVILTKPLSRRRYSEGWNDLESGVRFIMEHDFGSNEGPISISITGAAAAEVRQLRRKLDLSSDSKVIAQALRLLRDSVDVRLVTKDRIDPVGALQDYSQSYMPALRLWNVVAEMAPDHDLGQVKKITVDTTRGRKAVDWETDFKDRQKIDW